MGKVDFSVRVFFFLFQKHVSIKCEVHIYMCINVKPYCIFIFHLKLKYFKMNFEINDTKYCLKYVHIIYSHSRSTARLVSSLFRATFIHLILHILLNLSSHFPCRLHFTLLHFFLVHLCPLF